MLNWDLNTFGLWDFDEAQAIHILCLALTLASLRGFVCLVSAGLWYVISILAFQLRPESLSISHFL